MRDNDHTFREGDECHFYYLEEHKTMERCVRIASCIVSAQDACLGRLSLALTIVRDESGGVTIAPFELNIRVLTGLWALGLPPYTYHDGLTPLSTGAWA